MGPLGMETALARIQEIRSLVGLAGPPASPAAFADVLAAQVDRRAMQQGETNVQAASTEIPAQLNGRIPASALTSVAGGTASLAPAPATAFEAMSSAARADGVTLVVNEGYRTLDRQRELADRLGLYRDGGLAAVPGTSAHGRAISIDIDTEGGALAWLRQRAREFGFVEDVPREPWHWTYRPS